MALDTKIKTIQQLLAKQKVDGWLLYDNHGSNRFARQILEIPPHAVLTRRFFYWIPKEGTPQRIVHRIEAESLAGIPGKTHLYLSWQELKNALKEILKDTQQIVMEYSPAGANPYVSVVDAGTIEMVRETGVEVLSSADLLQQFTSVLSERQIETHLAAALVLEATVQKAWEWITDHLRKERSITEYDVQQFMLHEFRQANCMTEEGPICAVNLHTALPHYAATELSAKKIVRGDFILLDLWCKKNIPDAVYGDIARVAIADSAPTELQQKVFEIVKTAQKKGIDFVSSKMKAQQPIRGADVDDVCRGYIKTCGYGAYFTHRTGHNIDTHVHGAGAHLDNLETADYRLLLPGMCFSIEPGIYLPGDFGIRLESDLLIRHDGSVEITGGFEENITCLL